VQLSGPFGRLPPVEVLGGNRHCWLAAGEIAKPCSACVSVDPRGQYPRTSTAEAPRLTINEYLQLVFASEFDRHLFPSGPLRDL
jgi:hypothetical protein